MRLGAFSISRRFIDSAVHRQCPEALAQWSAVFSKCVVIHADHRYDKGTIDYVVFCPEFDDLPDGLAAPRYELAIDKHESFDLGHPVVTFQARFVRSGTNALHPHSPMQRPTRG